MFLNDMCKFIISNIKLNVFQKHRLGTAIRTLHNNRYIDPLLGEKFQSKIMKKTINAYNGVSATKHREK